MPAFSRGAAHESELWVSRRPLDACDFSISMAAPYFPDMAMALHPQLAIQIANVREEMEAWLSQAIIAFSLSLHWAFLASCQPWGCSLGVFGC